MKLNKSEYKKEEEYFAKVESLIEENISLLDDKIKTQKQEIYETKKYIWEECQGLSELELGGVRMASEFQVKQIDSKINRFFKF